MPAHAVIKTLRKLAVGHVISIAAKRGIAPGGVRRIGRNAPTPAEGLKPVITQRMRCARRPQRLLAILWLFTRAGKTAHVGDGVYAVLSEQTKKFFA